MSRRITIVGVVAFGLLAAVPGPALARRALKPRLGPVTPTLMTPITVTWKARRGGRYSARLSIRNPDYLDCSGYSDVALSPTRRGYVGTLKPQGGDFATSPPKWCPGSALVTIIRSGVRGFSSTVLAGERVTIALAPGEQPPGERPGVPVKVTILQGSTLTATAAGRPDRSSSLAGTLRGEIPSRFKPNTDITVGKWSGALSPTSLAADPLCPGTAAPASVDIVPTSNMVLHASGIAQFDLTLNTAPSQLFGCGPTGAPAGTTTIPLTGQVGPKGLQELPLTGSVNGISLPEGSQGGLAASLLLAVDLSGKG